MEENMIVIIYGNTFYFDFDWPKNTREKLKHKIKFIIKSRESLAENKTRLNNYC